MKKLLILRQEHIGDYMLSLKAVAGIRNKFPKAQIDIVVGPWNKTLAEATHYVDKVIVFDNPLVGRELGHIKLMFAFVFNFINMFKFLKKVNKANYDLVIDFSKRKNSKFLFDRIKASKKLTGIDNLPKKIITEFERTNNLVKLLNVKIPESASLIVSQKQKTKVKLLVGKTLKKNIVFHPITPIDFKNWPMVKWVKLSKELTLNGHNIFVIGGNEQKHYLEKAFKNKNVKVLAGDLSLIESYYLIGLCDVIVCSDSGPMHMAELENTPIVALFGPTFENIWGPYRKKDKILKNDNINEIVVKDVLNGVSKVLK